MISCFHSPVFFPPYVSHSRGACDVESSFLFIIGRCHDYLNRGIVVMPGLIRYPLLFPLSRHSRGACDEESLLMGLD